MIGPNGKEPNCFSKFIVCHSKLSVLNNAGVMWCAKKKSYAGPVQYRK